MAINWYPGHMHKAKKEIREVIPKMDLIIEVLDARLPFSSENPMVASLRKDTPCIKILNKSDLADPAVTQQWVDHINRTSGMKAIAVNLKQPDKIRSILAMAPAMVPERNLEVSQLKAIILGIPNVGKSTTINILASRTVAKTGNEPAVTRQQQRIKLPNNIVLLDTPGFLWPKLEPEDCGYRLAISGAIKNTVIEFEDVAMYLAEFMMQHYPDALLQRYQLKDIPQTGIELFDRIGQRRGCMRRGGIADTHKVAEILINEFRDGQLGRITLETPEMITTQLQAMEAAKVAREADKAEK
ncbi:MULTISPECIES: ribosome biogenesis GTPase YlqF [Gammaproteobacteria]|uniref:ribosome biogenesis GTPase YlqF n=1 Tax=Gammaproteobacteria TaxID=1236 RepID=UPI001ADC6F1A|nr:MULTISPECIES: ribosome biogenesis GTPase YlqF [Gammaproteobacteria]MBO9480613.1 ribosome biogenesis GTPase YlqF [Salinisphaera sp. G21_0]MBO9496721.1 ribosome biogenesis GTPase YlqF [Thalassotalea sp. G20_0]